ncbi:MAG: hypothetical protein IPJ84_18555 [Bdellovibrionales bacterium]|nr:hypothetical protein [Bdellovibrionales bacterium]
MSQSTRGLFSLVLFTALGALAPINAAQAVSNPLIRVCITNGGQFESQPDSQDEIALCRWGNAIVDSQTLLSNLNEVQSEAAAVLLNDVTSPDCAALGAVNWTINSTTRSPETVCTFNDSSRLSLSLAISAPDSAVRVLLKDILGRRP